MVTDLFAATITDMLVQTKEDFFSQAKKERAEKLVQTLGKDYPSSVIDYLSTVEETSFLSDIKEISSALGGHESILDHAAEWKENGAFQAFLTFLIEKSSVLFRTPLSGKSFLHGHLEPFYEAQSVSIQQQRILVREAQELLLAATGVDSPLMQIATELPEEDMIAFEESIKKFAPNSIPAVQVNTSLLGGSRMFKNGVLTDHSWQAKLHALFAKMR